MPLWWTAAAHLEAEWRIKGKWSRGSLKDLARNFSCDREGAKSLAAITKMRADPRYLPMVEQLMQAAARPLAPLPDAEERAKAMRETMLAAYRKITNGEG